MTPIPFSLCQFEKIRIRFCREKRVHRGGELFAKGSHVTSRNQGAFSREEERGPWERG